MIRGHIRQAHELFEEARQAYAEMGQQFQAALAARSLAFTLSMAGRPEEARSASVEALRVLIGYGARTECYLVLNNLALVWLVLAQVRKAERIFAHLVAHLDPTHPFFPLVARNSILPLMEQKRWEAALRRAESLDQEFETDPYPLEKARTGRLIGEILLLMDRPDEALAPLQRAADLLDSLEAGHDWAQATALLGQARLSIGQRREAEKLLGAALRYYAEGGFALDLLQLMEAWAEAARQGGTGGREFAAFRRYWQFKPAPASPVEGSSDPS
jgi:tetratricopeptide (TPR) repeat protein